MWLYVVWKVNGHWEIEGNRIKYELEIYYRDRMKAQIRKLDLIVMLFMLLLHCSWVNIDSLSEKISSDFFFPTLRFLEVDKPLVAYFSWSWKGLI